MLTKKTRIRRDGSKWSIIEEATGRVMTFFDNEKDALHWQQEYEDRMNRAVPNFYQTMFGPNILGKKSTHMVIDDGVVYKAPEEGPAYHVTADAIGKPYPYFGDPTKPMEQGGIYTLGHVEPLTPWAKQPESEAIDMEKLQRHIDQISKLGKPMVPPLMSQSDVRLDDFLRTVPMKDMLDAIFWQMAKKENYPGVFPPTPDQYNEIMNYIFDNYVGPQDGSKHAPHNRAVQEEKGKNTAFDTLLRKLNQYRGIRSAKMLFDDFPRSATITVMIDPVFEFDDDEHMASWESNLSKLFKEHKPAKLGKLEIMFTRTEVL